MLRKTVIIAFVVLMAATALTTTGCRAVRLPDTSRTTSESKTVALDGATTIETRIRMGVGELSLSGETSATDALKADFTYEPVSWKPEVSYAVDGGVGKLEVRQPEPTEVPAFKSAHNTWGLVLAGGAPTDLSLQLGVGRSVVDLRNVDVRKLDVLSGVGDCTVDLTGPRANGLTGRVEAGVGKLTIRLPKGVGVRVGGREDGVGHTTADGFIAQGGSWVNEAYSGSGPRIEIELVRGIGDVTLVLVD
ncbi:MAG TPA: toast rack family protein [Coriobacteriia bacterium]